MNELFQEIGKYDKDEYNIQFSRCSCLLRTRVFTRSALKLLEGSGFKKNSSMPARIALSRNSFPEKAVRQQMYGVAKEESWLVFLNYASIFRILLAVSAPLSPCMLKSTIISL